jgi:hypothetical protein
MCDPLTIAGIAMTAGSTVANTMASNRVAKARSQALSAERTRQTALDQEAQARNVISQDRFGPAYEAGREKTAAKLGDVLAKQSIATDSASMGGVEAPPSTSDVTVQETAKQQAGARAYGQKQGQALGNLRSFGDYLGDTSRLQGRDAGLVGQIGKFKEGSSSVVPYELDAASHKGDSLKMFGDLLNFGGSLAMGKGLQGSFDPAAGAAAASGAGPWGASLPAATDPWSGLRTVSSAASPAYRPKRVLGLGHMYLGSS